MLNGSSGMGSLVVRIRGRDLRTGRFEFRAHLTLESSVSSYEATRVYEADEPLELQVEADFEPGKATTAGATVLGFQRMQIELTSPRSICAYVEHAKTSRKNCHLVCFENGETSEGPCLNCPDGEYQIRICC